MHSNAPLDHLRKSLNKNSISGSMKNDEVFNRRAAGSILELVIYLTLAQSGCLDEDHNLVHKP